MGSEINTQCSDVKDQFFHRYLPKLPPTLSHFYRIFALFFKTKEYVLDIIKAYGKFTKSTKVGEPENSLMRMWAEEFKAVSEENYYNFHTQARLPTVA